MASHPEREPGDARPWPVLAIDDDLLRISDPRIVAPREGAPERNVHRAGHVPALELAPRADVDDGGRRAGLDRPHQVVWVDTGRPHRRGTPQGEPAENDGEASGPRRHDAMG